jgi:type IV pilus assembly protein PilN
VSSEEARLQNELRLPENAAVFDYSVFLNDLLRRKGVRWTLIFSDLEQVMPHNVKIIQVRPQVYASDDRAGKNEILLEMVVASENPEPVVDMLKALEGSRLFGATAVTNQQPPTDTEPLYRYRVNVRYAREL